MSNGKLLLKNGAFTHKFFYNGATASLGQGLLIVEASRSHSDTPHSVGLPWTSDQPDVETSTSQHSQQTAIYAPAGFEPAIPASEQPQIHALDVGLTEGYRNFPGRMT